MSSGLRIKQLRQKANGNYENKIPIGAEAQYIDMESGLDLEEELKLGSNHYVEISEANENYTLIRQYYLDVPKGNSSLANLLQHIKYSVLTYITEEDITSYLFRGDITSLSDAIHVKKINFIDTPSLSLTTVDEELDIQLGGN